MEQLARRQDLNPNEHICYMLGTRLRNHPNRPNILEDEGRFIIEIWYELDQNVIRKLILSMNRRIDVRMHSETAVKIADINLLEIALYLIEYV